MRLAIAILATALSAVNVAQAAPAASLAKTPMGPGPVVFFNISAVDLDKATTFYAALLGWTFQHETPAGYDFMLIFDQGKLIGEIDKVAAVGRPGGVAMYFPVADLRAAFGKAKALGAVAVFEPMTIPSDTVAGAIAMVQDPDGNSLGLYSPDPLQ